MTSLGWSLVAAASILAAGASGATAQSAMHVAVAGGPTEVVYKDCCAPESRGAHFQLSIAWLKPSRMLGLRLDAFAQRLWYEGDSIRFARNTIPGATASVMVFPLAGRTAWIHPYALFGAGGYGTLFGSSSPGETRWVRQKHFGMSQAAGVQFGRGRRGVSIEVSDHHIMDGGRRRLIPVSVGFRFPVETINSLGHTI